VSVAVLMSTTANAGETLMTDTIKTGTTLMEEGTLLPESLQCGSEPWTSFYTAGGIIRELRKASGKQNKYGSEGNKAHAGSLPKDDLNGGTGVLDATRYSRIGGRLHLVGSPIF
jgi:hypothetical protein